MAVHAAFTVTRADFALALDIELESASVVAILGPNGSGKTTLLRALAGLIPIDQGFISINHTIVDDAGRTFAEASSRSIGFVFQDYALFPHLSALDNIAFGLRTHGSRRSQARATAQQMLDQFGLGHLSASKPEALSGGQAQRVALARALAIEPEVLLLDEPLAALDAQTKEALRPELAQRLRAFPGTTVLVTHDPLDALVLADRVIVLEAGAVVQDDSPADLTKSPGTDYVAAVAGVTLLRGTARHGAMILSSGGVLHISDHLLQGPAVAVIRPESVTVHRFEPEGSARNAWQEVVSQIQPLVDRVLIHTQGDPPMKAAITFDAYDDMGITIGSSIWLSVKAVDVHAYAAAVRE
ncbi:MAG: ABC transporter ATP-binding protein [Candidatus Nanopelagicales bacterium]